MHIIPIICIEYYILSFLVQNNYLKVSDENTDLVNNLILLFDFNNESVNHFINSNSYRQESLEHVYKELLSYLAVNSLCMSNHTQQSKNSYIGCFYSKNCDCDLKYCKSKCRAKLSEKAERFYVELPVFDVVDLNHDNLLKSLDIHTEDLNFKKVYDNIYKF